MNNTAPRTRILKTPFDACRYCGTPVEADWDPETGHVSIPEYHFDCLNLPGEWTVVSYFGNEARAHVRSFAFERRAHEEASHLADCNRCRSTFVVISPDGVEVARFEGNLSEARPDGTPFYGEVWTRDGITV